MTLLANPPDPPRRSDQLYRRPVYAQSFIDLGSLGVRAIRASYIVEHGELDVTSVQLCQHNAFTHDDQFWRDAEWLWDFLTQDQELALYETCRRHHAQRQIAKWGM